MKRFLVAGLAASFILVYGHGIGSKQPDCIDTDGLEKKYPSLLWEVSGKGLKKPSYLFGTMHISSKTVFNLCDSFCKAIKSVDAVALEQDPEVWQDIFFSDSVTYVSAIPFNTRHLINNNSKFNIHTFALLDYQARLKAALGLEARLPGGMLYRTTPGREEFEEDTFLDMYIYKTGKRLKKKIVGLEDYVETERLLRSAYLAVDKERDRDARSFSYEDEVELARLAEEAYKKGDLDLLDSLQKLDMGSRAFQEIFMERRNVIQADAIDSVLGHHSVFAAVGAAHLPGENGLIALLRQKGYNVRAVTVGRNRSAEMDMINNLRVPVSFSTRSVTDGLFTVATPGPKFYKHNSQPGTASWQYYDLANGCYYMVHRLRTNAAILGQDDETVKEKLAGMLYEYIPGKIVERREINRQGYIGFAITNRTRKGDVQQYNIYALPNEIIILKVGGPSGYISAGGEAQQFLNSLQFSKRHGTQNYDDSNSGFRAVFPSMPATMNAEDNVANRAEWVASDSIGNSLLVLKYSSNQFEYLEEDSFCLAMAEESFAASGMQKVDMKLERKFGRAVLNASYLQKKQKVKARFFCLGNSIYAVVSNCLKAEDADMYINTVEPVVAGYERTTSIYNDKLQFGVKVTPLAKPQMQQGDYEADELTNGLREPESKAARKLLSLVQTVSYTNRASGEEITVNKIKLHDYFNVDDTAALYKRFCYPALAEHAVVANKVVDEKNGWKALSYQLTKPASTCVLYVRTYYRKSCFYQVLYKGDALMPVSNFATNFFDSFEPLDSSGCAFQQVNKSALFFSHYYSADEEISAAARMLLDQVEFKSVDLPSLKHAVMHVPGTGKEYLELKRNWIKAIGKLKTDSAADVLRDIYIAVKDTSDFQNQVLEALTSMKTAYSFSLFKDLVLYNPPALTASTLTSVYPDFLPEPLINLSQPGGNGQHKWQGLFDTLSLSATLLPELSDLLYLEDYKPIVLELMAAVANAGYLGKDHFEQMVPRLLLEAKQLLKKQIATEEQTELERAAGTLILSLFELQGNGNQRLEIYASVLSVFMEEPQVKSFFESLLRVKDPAIKLHVATILLKYGREVPDTILQSLATSRVYSLRLYKQLTRIAKKESKNVLTIPPQQLALSYLFQSAEQRADTIEYLYAYPVEHSGLKGLVFAFKYKKAKADKDWLVALSGIHPAPAEMCGDPSADISAFYNYKLMQSQPVEPQIEKLIKQRINALRPFASEFYEGE